MYFFTDKLRTWKYFQNVILFLTFAILLQFLQTRPSIISLTEAMNTISVLISCLIVLNPFSTLFNLDFMSQPWQAL